MWPQKNGNNLILMQKTYPFRAKIWLYAGPAPWHFITLPTEIAAEIRELFEEVKRGWGSLPVEVTMGKTTWKTSIFPDKKSKSYLLPVKAEMRKKEKVGAGDEVNLELKVSD